MGLIVKRTGDAEYGQYLKVLVAGESGAGKTVLASNFPAPFFASAEGGLMSIADRGIPYVDIKTSHDLMGLRIMLDQPKQVREDVLGSPVETIVIDTIDEVQRILMRERLEETRKETLALQDWGWLGDQMQAIIRGFRSLEMHVVFLVHLKDTQDQDSGRVWTEPGLQGQIAKQIPAAVDLALALRAAERVDIDDETKQTVRRQVRILMTQPTVQFPWLKDRSGKLTREIEVGLEDSFDLLYDPIFANNAKGKESEILADISNDEVAQMDQGPPEPVAEVIEPKPEPVLAAAPQPEVATPQVVAEPTPAPEPEPEPKVEAPKPAEKPAESVAVCEECGVEVDNDWRDLSKIKYRTVLCRDHYRARKAG